MALTADDILTEVRVEIGDLDGDIYSDDDIKDTYIPAGLNMMKGRWLQEYSIDSAGTISPDPSDDDYNDRRAVVLHAALAVINAELRDSARKAIYHSNVAGSTDLRARFDAIKSMREDIIEELEELYLRKLREQYESDMEFSEIRRSAIAFDHD